MSVSQSYTNRARAYAQDSMPVVLRMFLSFLLGAEAPQALV